MKQTNAVANRARPLLLQSAVFFFSLFFTSPALRGSAPSKCPSLRGRLLPRACVLSNISTGFIVVSSKLQTQSSVIWTLCGLLAADSGVNSKEQRIECSLCRQFRPKIWARHAWKQNHVHLQPFCWHRYLGCYLDWGAETHSDRFLSITMRFSFLSFLKNGKHDKIRGAAYTKIKQIYRLLPKYVCSVARPKNSYI